MSTWDTPSLQQVLRGLKKVTVTKPGTPGLEWKDVIRLKALAFATGEYEIGTLFVLACAFLFRVPNELLPLCYDSVETHSRIEMPPHPFSVNEDGTRPKLTIVLRPRKNCPAGSVLTRQCICKVYKDGDGSLVDHVMLRNRLRIGEVFKQHPLCPVHAMFDFFKFRGLMLDPPDIQAGQLFHTSAASFQLVLRRLGHHLDIGKAACLTSKAFRRGSARELFRSGCTMAQVLIAGQWKSAAFMDYLIRSEVDEKAVFSCMEDLSDEEPDVPLAKMAHDAELQRRGTNPFRAIGSVPRPSVAGPAIQDINSPMNELLAIEDYRVVEGTVTQLPVVELTKASSKKLQPWEAVLLEDKVKQRSRKRKMAESRRRFPQVGGVGGHTPRLEEPPFPPPGENPYAFPAGATPAGACPYGGGSPVPSPPENVNPYAAEAASRRPLYRDVDIRYHFLPKQ
jgi:hypothetical protein